MNACLSFTDMDTDMHTHTDLETQITNIWMASFNLLLQLSNIVNFRFCDVISSLVKTEGEKMTHETGARLETI